MSARAAEMAKIIMEEWNSDTESAEAFTLRRFRDDKFSNLKKAVAILTELEQADEEAADWFDRGKGVAFK